MRTRRQPERHPGLISLTDNFPCGRDATLGGQIEPNNTKLNGENEET